ncbi:hypothetical protein FB451DRAFT_1013223, partial [Mycena latifolia]
SRTSTLGISTMMTTMHFSVGDTLWLPAGCRSPTAPWRAHGSACLCLRSSIDRLRRCGRVRAMGEGNWRATVRAACKNAKGNEKDGNWKGRKGGGMELQAPPFVPAHDVIRGAMHALQAVFGFGFMLAIM